MQDSFNLDTLILIASARAVRLNAYRLIALQDLTLTLL